MRNQTKTSISAKWGSFFIFSLLSAFSLESTVCFASPTPFSSQPATHQAVRIISSFLNENAQNQLTGLSQSSEKLLNERFELYVQRRPRQSRRRFDKRRYSEHRKRRSPYRTGDSDPKRKLRRKKKKMRTESWQRDDNLILEKLVANNKGILMAGSLNQLMVEERSST